MAPWFNLMGRCVAPWSDTCTAAWLGVAVCGSCSVVGLCWWACVSCVCVTSAVCLRMLNHNVSMCGIFLVVCALGCCARGGCRAGLSAPGALVARGVVLCVCGIFASCMYSTLIRGLLPGTSCSVVGLRFLCVFAFDGFLL